MELIDKIKDKNKKAKKELEDAGIDYDKWLNYSNTKEFLIGVNEEEKQNRLNSFQTELCEIIINLIGKKSKNELGLLSEEKAKKFFNSIIKKHNIKFSKEEKEMNFLKNKSISNIENILKDIIQFLEEEIKNDFSFKEVVGTSLDHLKNITQGLLDIKKEMKQKSYPMLIKLWDRQPGYDIFQGNYTHCCIAIENFNRGVILDYLLDSSLNIIEIKDQNTEETIAQTFVFIAQNEKGENILVLDNIEVNNNYRGLTTEIINQLFDYVNDFANFISKDPKKRLIKYY